MIAFAANPCGFCRESFVVITQDEQPTIAFAADPRGFCCASFAVTDYFWKVHLKVKMTGTG